jgi:ATP-binding cassette, subfamily B, bacterial
VLVWAQRMWQQSLHRRVVRELFHTSRSQSAAIGAYLVGTTVSTVALVLVSGSIVGRLPTAVRDGGRSAAAERIWVLVGLLAGALVAQQIFLAVHDAVLPRLARAFDAGLRERVMAAALAPPRVDHLSDAAVIDDIAAATTLGTARFGPLAAAESLPQLLMSLLTGLAMAAIVGWYRWWLGLLLAATWLLARRARQVDLIRQYRHMGTASVGTKRQSYFRQLSMAPGAAKEIRVFGLSGWVVSSFHQQWLETMRVAWKVRRKYPWQLIVSLIAAPVVTVLAFAVIVNAAKNGDINLRSLSILLTAVLGTAVMAEPGGITIFDMMYAMGGATIESVARMEKRFGPALVSRESPIDRSAAGTIQFDHVSFRYRAGGPLVLDGLHLDLIPGRSMAIVGANGAGKTTIVRLLCGLLEPSSGSISVAGTDLRSLDPDRHRSRCAVVWQDFARFPLSARDNIAIGSNGALTDAELDDIAVQAGLTDVVASLPNGWDTPLNSQLSGGVDLSGGQWQRFALGRALAALRAGASVLVMDEPTANLDVRAEAAFYDRFLEMTAGSTTLVISHRFATVRRADTIAVLEQGRITEHGSHDELTRREGTYARLFRLQSSPFDPPLQRDVDA